jgi:hypothetical protein
MGTESFLLLLLAIVYGYHAAVLLFGSLHCCSLVLGAAVGVLRGLRGARQLLRVAVRPSRARARARMSPQRWGFTL